MNRLMRVFGLTKSFSEAIHQQPGLRQAWARGYHAPFPAPHAPNHRSPPHPSDRGHAGPGVSRLGHPGRGGDEGVGPVGLVLGPQDHGRPHRDPPPLPGRTQALNDLRQPPQNDEPETNVVSGSKYFYSHNSDERLRTRRHQVPCLPFCLLPYSFLATHE